MRRLLIAGIVLGLATGAYGQTWDEILDGGGDAGELGIGDAQLTVGVGALSQITGTIDVDDADVFGIRIVDEANFQAETFSATWDTQLFLFNDDGSGQVENDDASGHGLQSWINSDGVFENGLYYLGISRYNKDPRDEFDAAIFGFTTYPGSGDQRMPTSENPYTHWSSSSSSAGAYTINLRGAEYFVPEPASLALLGLAGLIATRRR